MRKRVYLCLTFVAMCLVFAVLFNPGCRCVLIGLVNGENFYRGKPTSYWRGQVKESIALVKQLRLSGRVVVHHHRETPGLLDQFRKQVLAPFMDEGLFPDGDPAALPVLLDLLKDDAAEVRAYGAMALSRMGRAAEVAISPLTTLLTDESPEVRRSALVALTYIKPDVDFSVPILVAMLRDKHAIVRARAANRLGELGAPAVAAVPALELALNDQDEQVRVEVVAALKKMQQ